MDVVLDGTARRLSCSSLLQVSLNPVSGQRRVLIDRRLEELHEIDASSEISDHAPALSQTGTRISSSV